MKRFLFISVFLLLGIDAVSQGEIDLEDKALIRNERTFFVLVNTNGIGLGYSFGKMINIHRKTQWSFDFCHIRDPKEVKIGGGFNQKRFVFGKLNDFFVTRAGYGYLHKIYQKKDQGGIEIRLFYNAGLSVGILKPMYYYVSGSKIERFDVSTLKTPIGGAPYTKGMNEISFVPGAHTRFGVSFEFSNRDLLINAFECGATLDLFPKKIEIMGNNRNQFYFLSLFFSYRFGKVINTRVVSDD